MCNLCCTACIFYCCIDFDKSNAEDCAKDILKNLQEFFESHVFPLDMKIKLNEVLKPNPTYQPEFIDYDGKPNEQFNAFYEGLKVAITRGLKEYSSKISNEISPRTLEVINAQITHFIILKVLGKQEGFQYDNSLLDTNNVLKTYQLPDYKTTESNLIQELKTRVTTFKTRENQIKTLNPQTKEPKDKAVINFSIANLLSTTLSTLSIDNQISEAVTKSADNYVSDTKNLELKIDREFAGLVPAPMIKG